MKKLLDIHENLKELQVLMNRHPLMAKQLSCLSYINSYPNAELSTVAKIVRVSEEEITYWSELYRYGGVKLLLDPHTILARNPDRDVLKEAHHKALDYQRRTGQRLPRPTPKPTKKIGPFIASRVDLLDGELVKKNDNNRAECVTLTRYVELDGNGKVPPSWTWRPGASVLGNNNIRWGTAIATFINGRFPGTRETGQHSGFFLEMSLDGQGFKILEQFPGLRTIQIRELRSQGNCTNQNRVNNANCFSVIMAEVEI